MTQDKALEILNSGANVFLTGEPGAGKSYTVNLFIAELKRRGKNFGVTASTGIAATHINGMTIHSWSKIGMRKKIDENNLFDMGTDRFVTARINDAKVLIIDEVSMLSANVIDMLDKVLRHFKDGSRPFGGIQIVFVGDFFQLPPVVKHGKMQFAFESEAWEKANLKICYLTEQHRQSDSEFLQILSFMRQGFVTDTQKNKLRACSIDPAPETHLFTHNIDVDRMNQEELDKLPGESKRFTARTSAVHPKVLEILKDQMLSPFELDLKVGAVVMFTRNNFDAGFVNGTIGEVVDFEDGQPVVLTRGGKTIIPKRESWKFEENGKVKAEAIQIPLRLAWAITVHKSQGMSLDEATVDLSGAFVEGQGYVAISRVRSMKGLNLIGLNEKAFEMHPRVVRKDKEFRKLSE